MLCECGKPIEPAYEQTGKCEDCYADIYAGSNNKDYKKWLEPDNEPKPGAAVSEEDALALPVSDLELSDIITNRLSEVGIIYARDLVKKTEAELIDMRNFGKKTLSEIKKHLQRFGLKLKQPK